MLRVSELRFSWTTKGFLFQKLGSRHRRKDKTVIFQLCPYPHSDDPVGRNRSPFHGRGLWCWETLFSGLLTELTTTDIE